ncbi:MAG: diguanylate cyclase [Solirubrobacteraceae bacterium]
MLTAQLLFATPLAVSAWATIAAIGAARRHPTRRAPWICFGVACAIAGGSSALALLDERAGLYAGLAASVGVLLGCLLLTVQTLRLRGWVALLDALVPASVGASLFVYLLVLPGFTSGDPILTLALVIDLLAVVLGATGAAPGPVKAGLLGVITLVAVADSIPASEAAGIEFLPAAFTPVLWAVACAGFAWAANHDVHFAPRRERSDRVLSATAMLPLAAIVGYPVIVGLLAIAREGDWLEPVAFFGPLFLASTAAAFARQASLLVEQRRRNRELEALTGLAATMTEVLEERPVIARGLEALQAAARTTASAVHLFGPTGELELAATAGDWPSDSNNAIELPLRTRGRRLGVLSLVRPERADGFARELPLLGLLADQLAVALQTTRDHQEKLEAAIRDPLTGLYNRRFFYESFSQEIARQDRYGGGAALVLFDIDDFRHVNETLGSQTGDDVLQEVGRILSALVRPSDTFARIGGEEFGLLMPHTGQLDALLVAERLRTAVGRHPILPGHAVTLSGGVAAMPQDGTTREELERHADQALYWAKRNGKNMCAVASEAIADDAESVQAGMLAHLHGVVAGIDAEHLHTRDHSENVAAYAVAISQELGLADERIVRLRRAAFLHDIGKVAVSHTILGKPAGLTDEEFEAIKVHPQVGETMLHHAGLHDEARWVGAHHERLDGRGYPHGLRSEEIPVEARIIFVADSFEAMTSDRPYRRGMPVEDALAELRRCAGTQFDPRVVETLATLVEHGRMSVLALRDRA